MTAFRLERDGDERECTVAVESDLLAKVVPDLKMALACELAAGVLEVRFDLPHTQRLDPSALGLLLALANSLEAAHGRVEVWRVQPKLLKVFHRLGLAERLNVRGA
ncbi:MAG: STAS domain-containing protein [Myxococcales bacterium]